MHHVVEKSFFFNNNFLPQIIKHILICLVKNKIINIVKNHHKDDKKVAEVISIVKEKGGLEYAEKVMHNYHNNALNILKPFHENDAKKSLQLLLDYVVNRKK